MGINYPIQNGLASLYKYKKNKIGTHGAPKAPPPGPLAVGGAPPSGGPPGPGGSQPIIIAPATVALWIRVCHYVGPPTH
jgi:hypothetical protein